MTYRYFEYKEPESMARDVHEEPNQIVIDESLEKIEISVVLVPPFESDPETSSDEQD